MLKSNTTWRFLVVEDNPEIMRNIKDILPTSVPEGDMFEIEPCPVFKSAQARMANSRYDMLILDLKDDTTDLLAVDTDPPGVAVFNELKKYRFTPVVFYTAWAEKVRDYETSFVKVVEKTDDVTNVRKAIQAVFATNLPNLTKLIDDVEREYLWEFISKTWKNPDTQFDKSDLAHLVARRLSIALEEKLGNFAISLVESAQGTKHKETVHPMAVYIYPPISTQRMAGDILYEKEGYPKSFWLVMTPSCDFVKTHFKVEHVLLVKCEELKIQQEYSEWATDRSKHENLENVFKNRRSGKRSVEAVGGTISIGLQPDRFRFLPGTFFIPELLVDFQQIKTIPYRELEKYDIKASLDSPYAEWIITSFISFFGRVGTPDIDKDIVMMRLETLLSKEGALQADSQSACGGEDEATK